MNNQAIYFYGALIVTGLFHILFPGVARALWNWQEQYEEEHEDLTDRVLDELGMRQHWYNFDASLLSYRLLGVGMIAPAGIIWWYAR